jgi:hypothetical protein
MWCYKAQSSLEKKEFGLDSSFSKASLEKKKSQKHF